MKYHGKSKRLNSSLMHQANDSQIYESNLPFQKYEGTLPSHETSSRLNICIFNTFPANWLYKSHYMVYLTHFAGIADVDCVADATWWAVK